MVLHNPISKDKLLELQIERAAALAEWKRAVEKASRHLLKADDRQKEFDRLNDEIGQFNDRVKNYERK